MMGDIRKKIQKYKNLYKEHSVSQLYEQGAYKVLKKLDEINTSKSTFPKGFALVDPDMYHNDEETFFRFVSASLHALQNIGVFSGLERFRLQNAVLQNLGVMIDSAVRMRSRFVKEEGAKEEQWESLTALLKLIEDEVILKADISRYTRMFLLDLKYSHRYSSSVSEGVYRFWYGTARTFDIGSYVVQLDGMEISGDRLVINGYFRLPAPVSAEAAKLVIYVNGRRTSYQPVERYTHKYLFGRLFSANQGFTLTVPLEDSRYEIRFKVRVKGTEMPCTNIAYNALCPVNKDLVYGYYYKDGYVLQGTGTLIRCIQCDAQTRESYENNLRGEIRKLCPDRADDLIALREFRLQYNRQEHKPVWLLIDRVDRADDNAEALFRFLCEENDARIEPCFVLSRVSPAFWDIQKCGKVLDFHSFEHLRKFLISDFILSSQMAPSTRNPFNEDARFFRDLMHDLKFIFLQHGLTHNDNGYAFSHFVRDFYAIITSAGAESDYLRSPEFFNRPESIWETGMPRFDYLYHDEKRRITIMPTWRKSLTSRVFDDKKNTKIWRVSEHFTESSYFHFYNGLINHPDLIAAARAYGYQIDFMLHVQFQSMGSAFDRSDPEIVHICASNTRFRDVFAKSSLLVSDYSSILFDFAWLRKPVVYCQFDKADFFASHTVRPGYFDFDRDGFGEVTDNLEDTVQVLIRYMESDCALKEQYRKRMDDFFAFSDHNCCRRIYDRLLKESFIETT